MKPVSLYEEDRIELRCGSCGLLVTLLKLKQHRDTCYKLHKYKDISYLYIKVSLSECDIHVVSVNERLSFSLIISLAACNTNLASIRVDFHTIVDFH